MWIEIGVRCWNWRLELDIGIGDCGLLRIGIGDRIGIWGLGIGNGDLEWRLGMRIGNGISDRE